MFLKKKNERIVDNLKSKYKSSLRLRDKELQGNLKANNVN